MNWKSDRIDHNHKTENTEAKSEKLKKQGNFGKWKIRKIAKNTLYIAMGALAMKMYDTHTKTTIDAYTEQHVVNILKANENERYQIQEILREPVTTFLAFNPATKQTFSFYTTTRYANDWIPQKSGESGIGDSINQTVPLMTSIYSGTFTIDSNGQLINSPYVIKRTIGDHLSDAEDYQIFQGNTLMEWYSIIASYSPSIIDKPIHLHSQTVDNNINENLAGTIKNMPR